MSHHVESTQPLTVAQTISPQSVRGVEPVLGAENVTLSWPRPDGRVDRYFVKWYPTDNVEDIRMKDIAGDVETEGIARTIDIVVGDLHPGVEYMFEITTEAHDLRSETVRRSVRTMPLITSEITIINKQEVTDAMTLRYTPTPYARSLFDTYRFRLSDPAVRPMEKAAQDPDRRVTFADLTPGRLYTISLFTVAGGVESRPLERQDRLHPEPVEDIAAADIKDKEITLYWNAPRGDFDSFEVQYLDTKDRLIQNTTSTASITIRDLRPFRNYTFTIITKSGSSVSSTPRRSTPVSAIFQTKESVPGSLTVFEPFEIHPSRITFVWELSRGEANGVLTGFTIQYGPKPLASDQPFIAEASREFAPDAREGNIEGLVPGETYTFQIQAQTQVGYGEWERWHQTMPIWAPPIPARDVFPTEIEHAKDQVKIRFRRNYFSDVNGRVVAYTIIVAEDYRKSTTNKQSLLKWQDVQQHRSWPPYQVSDPYYPFNNSSVEDFTVGADESCMNKNGYCNGPLKPGTTYRFKIRAYSAPDKHSETNWSQPITTDPDNTAALIGIIIPVILITVIVFVVIVARRMMHGTGANSNCMKRSEKVNLIPALSKLHAASLLCLNEDCG